MCKSPVVRIPLFLLCVAALPAQAQSSLSLEWDLRGRHEQVDDDDFADAARADSLRLRG